MKTECFISEPAGAVLEVIENYHSDGRIAGVHLVKRTPSGHNGVASCNFDSGDVYYIASPLSAPTKEGILTNAENALEYARFAGELFADGSTGYAPHASTYKYEENYRAAGLEYGKAILKHCKGIVVCGNVISAGMNAELDMADDLKLPMYKLADIETLRKASFRSVPHKREPGSYRALVLNQPVHDKAIVTQGHFFGVDDVKNYIVERNAKIMEEAERKPKIHFGKAPELDVGVFRVERKDGEKWVFVQNIIISSEKNGGQK